MNMGTNLMGMQNDNLNSDTAQKDSSSSKKIKPRYFPKEQTATIAWFHLDTLRFSDSQLLLNHRYTPNQRSVTPVLQLGVPGSPQFILNHNFKSQAFSLAPALATTYNIDLDNFNFHQVGQPYTRFQYAQGDGRFTGLEALHTQNFAPTWNVTLQYRSSINEDMYTGATQDNLSRNLGIGNHFLSQNKRYEQQIILSWNRNRRLENGGLLNDTAFYGAEPPPDQVKQRTFGLYLPALEGAESFLANTHHRIAQRYFLNNKLKSYVWHQFDYVNQRFSYQDKSRDSNYYGTNFNFNATFIHDSTSLRKDAHKWGWGYTDTHRLGIYRFEAAYLYQSAHLHSKNKDILTQNILHSSHGYRLYSSLLKGANIMHIEWEHQLSGYLSNNSALQAQVRHIFQDSSFMEIEFLHKNQSLNLFQNYFLNNHVDFRGLLPNLHRTQSSEISGRYHYRSENLSIVSALQLGQIQGDVRALFNSEPLILQNYAYVQSNIAIHYSLKHWMFFGSYHIQGNTAKEWTNLGLPTHFTRLGMSFQNSAFSNALIYRMGIDAAYVSSYAAWVYRADTRQFYGANNTILLGNYPLLDIFFSARIKTIDLFVKYEHLNYWWLIPGVNTRVETVLGYPIQPDRFRFGFTWHFWN